MKIFTNLFKPKKPLPEVKLKDPDFGEIKYDHDDGWDSILIFNNENVEICIAADINGPTDIQKQIWKEIKNNINSLNETSISLIRKELEDEWPIEFQSKKLTLFQLSIYNEKHHSESHFNMCYFLEGDDDGIHRVDYMNIKPLYYGRDD